MAQGKKGKRKATGPEAVAVVYGIDPESERYAAVREVLKANAVRPKVARPDRLGDPVGALAGMVGFRPSLAQWEGDVPDVESMVFCNVPSKTVDSVLAGLREAGVDVPLKAVLTKFNKSWPLAQLLAQLSAERSELGE